MHPTESAAQTPVRPTPTNVTTVNENIVNQNPTHLPMPHQTVPPVPVPILPKPQSSAVLTASPDVEFISFETPKKPVVKQEPMSIDEVDGRFIGHQRSAQMPVKPVNLNETFTDLAQKRVGYVAQTTTQEEF